MKTADCDILILPGYAGSEEEHWQARWAARLKTARIVAQDDWHRPDPEAWRARVALSGRSAPASMSGKATSRAPRTTPSGKRGAASTAATTPLLVASRTDPHCTYERAEDYAYAWGSALVDAGEAGHINVASGHGPWPEGHSHPKAPAFDGKSGNSLIGNTLFGSPADRPD
jgi:predicted alpha/beta hydrolase family esterase